MINQKKATLLELIAGKNRGLLATETDKVAILSAITQLEDFNPNPRPLEVPQLLEGNWRLLYTSSDELLGIGRFPLLRLGQIYQCIRVADQKVYNIAEVQSLPLLEGLVSVAAQFEAVSEKRVNVKFNRFIIGSQRFIGYQSPNSLIADIETGKKFIAIDFNLQARDQQGWLDITYLDADLRIGRGNVGSVFVLTKQA
ncbi:PAP/fibrillin family protein [Planktothrix mougeotii]|uniref:PAP/fibrillin family protein n=1 Tax=Planktothrix mougeotii LEGE 06226 TaxID=1828728 RepID=A0ABR9UH26_9CYAN|nr:PAP/fibrillin family protein [Planktothrix mougeotii]MBE9145776.1 PAP/fibrillin family protein [Planktothrix mougeotii LEGE 06226]